MTLTLPPELCCFARRAAALSLENVSVAALRMYPHIRALTPPTDSGYTLFRQSLPKPDQMSFDMYYYRQTRCVGSAGHTTPEHISTHKASPTAPFAYVAIAVCYMTVCLPLPQ